MRQVGLDDNSIRFHWDSVTQVPYRISYVDFVIGVEARSAAALRAIPTP